MKPLLRHLSHLVISALIGPLFIGCDDEPPTGTGQGGNYPPVAPANLKARAISLTDIQLTWTDWSGNENGFEIWESVGSDTGFGLTERTGPNVELFILRGKSTQYAYYYLVRAFNVHGFSNFSNIASLTNQWLRFTLRRSEAPYLAVSWHPRGYRLISGGGDYRVRIWDPSNGELINTLKRHTDIVECAAFSPDSSAFATGSEDGLVIVWDAVYLCPRQLLMNNGAVTGMKFFPDGTRLACTHGGVTVWDVWEGNPQCEIESETTLRNIEVTSNGRTIIAAGGNFILTFNADDGAPIDTMRVLSGGINCIALSEDDRLLVAGTGDGKLIYFEYQDGWEYDQTVQAHEQSIFSVDISSEIGYIVTGSWDWTIRLWNLETFALIRTLSDHRYSIYSVAFSTDGNYLASASGDRTIKIWGPFNAGD